MMTVRTCVVLLAMVAASCTAAEPMTTTEPFTDQNGDAAVSGFYPLH
jgi:hypothetical protein